MHINFFFLPAQGGGGLNPPKPPLDPPLNGIPFPQCVDAITSTVYEVTSPEKNDTKISNFGSVVCFLGHILWGNVEFQNFHFSAA